MEALNKLLAHVRERPAEIIQAKRQGAKIVGYTPGGYFPEELAHACGVIPAALLRGGDHEAVVAAGPYLARFLDTFSRAQIGYRKLEEDQIYQIIRLDNNGNVTDFSMNDKCAAGTGRFLEVMANALGLAMNEIGPESGRSENPCHISSTCTVFAESEVITLRARGASRPDLVAGIHQAVAKRVLLMATNLKGARVVFTGGVAKNSGVQRALEAELGQTLTVPEEPQLTGALGAACIAMQECLS